MTLASLKTTTAILAALPPVARGLDYLIIIGSIIPERWSSGSAGNFGHLSELQSPQSGYVTLVLIIVVFVIFMI